MKRFLVFIFCISVTISFSQNNNFSKILGCWKLEKVDFIERDEYSDEAIEQSKNSIVCFFSNGDFTTKFENSSEVIKGTFKISDDGKTLSQKVNDNTELTEDYEVKYPDADILILDSKNLVLQLDELVKLHFIKN